MVNVTVTITVVVLHHRYNTATIYYHISFIKATKVYYNVHAHDHYQILFNRCWNSGVILHYIRLLRLKPFQIATTSFFATTMLRNASVLLNIVLVELLAEWIAFDSCLIDTGSNSADARHCITTVG